MPVVESTEMVGGEQVAIRIEVDEPASSSLDEVYGQTRLGEKSLERAHGLFGGGLRVARACAEETVAAMAAMHDDSRPDEFQLQLAIKLDGELGAHIVKLKSEAQLQVTMTWRR